MSGIGFSVIIPARLSSVRLPEKALADIGGKPMVVRTAMQALESGASRVVVAHDHDRIQAACEAHGIACVRTGSRHQSGTERLAEAVGLLGLPDSEIIVNVQGDEPMIPPELIGRLAAKLSGCPAPVATAAHPIGSAEEFHNPNCVKAVTDAAGNALYFSRAPIPYPRDGEGSLKMPDAAPLRHIGIYAYRAVFLRQYPALAPSPLEQIEKLEQLRVLWHGFSIAVEVLPDAPPGGVDTPEDLDRVRASLRG